MISEQTILITGGTNGIGLAAARALAAQGAQIVIVGRNRTKAEQVVQELRAAHHARIDYLVADLSSQASLRQLAGELLARYPQLDVLINNAGGVFDRRQTTVDQIEYTFGLNHLGYFLLTLLLLDRLKASAPARIINVASSAEARGKLHFDDIQFTKSYSSFGAYAQSKLANLLFTYALARRLEGTGVTVNALHPGVVDSGFGRNTQNPLLQLAFGLIRLVSISPAQGADTIVFLATSPAVATQSGRYFINRKPARSNPLSYDIAAQERLWSLSEALTGWREGAPAAGVSA